MPQLGDLFERFEPAIRALPQDRPIGDDDLVGDTFRLEIYYAPMDWLRPAARIAVVGITPGRSTMLIAYQTAVDGLRSGDAISEILEAVNREFTIAREVEHYGRDLVNRAAANMKATM